MNKFSSKISAILFGSLLLLNVETSAKTRISIDSGNIDPIPIAINKLHDNEFSGSKKIKSEIFDVIASDLKQTGVFTLAKKGLFLEHTAFRDEPNFMYWNNLDFSIFTNINISTQFGKTTAELKIWNNTLNKLAHVASVDVKDSNYRKLAHKTADVIYEYLTGDKGYFNSRIAYVSEFKVKGKKRKKISISDYDGHNRFDLTDGNYLTLTPRFAPNDDYLMYVSYESVVPRVYIQKIAKNSRKKLVGEFSGMSFAPRFHPTGKKGIMSMSKADGTHLYEVNFNNSKLRRLTFGENTINTSPSYSPDGNKLVYCSDKGGSLQLYVMDFGNGKTKRISFGGGTYSAPVWSPRGDLIAFTKHSGGQFHIGVVRPNGKGERLLTSSWMDDSPTWSPNGRSIMFSRESNKSNNSELYIVDILGASLKKFDVKSSASDPCWDYDDD